MELILDKFHMLDIESDIHPSMFFTNEEYTLFILRLPKDFNDELEVESYPYVITKGSYYLYDRSAQEFNDLGSFQDLYLDIDKKVNEAMHVTKEIFSVVEEMEDSFYENRMIKDFNQQWFYYKNAFVRMGRVFSKSIHELEKFISKYKNTEHFLEIHFDDLLEHLERSNRSALHAIEKLDTLYNFHDSVHNEKMNKTIYILTVLSAFFLPLNLVVGFFGMNTTNLPFSKDVGGTFYVISILFVLVLFTFLLILFLKKFYKTRL